MECQDVVADDMRRRGKSTVQHVPSQRDKASAYEVRSCHVAQGAFLSFNIVHHSEAIRKSETTPRDLQSAQYWQDPCSIEMLKMTDGDYRKVTFANVISWAADHPMSTVSAPCAS